MTAQPAARGLGSLVVRGIAWKGATQLVFQGSSIVVAVVLARLLAPHDFGLAGMVLVFSSLVLVFSDLALGAALVQRRTLTEEDRSTVFWLSLGTGALFTAAGIAASGPLARFYGEPDVQPLFAALSFSFVVVALGTTQSALLARDMDFRRLELRQIAGMVSGAVVGIAVALQGFGAWAIIAQHLTIATVSTTLLWLVSPWRPRFTFSLASLRDLGAFSGFVFAHRLLYYLHRNVDKLLVGRVLGPAALGVYVISYNVMLLPASRLAGPVQEVLFPAFSRLQDDSRRMAEVWFRTIRLVGSISIPAMLGLMVVAPDFVRVVLGDRWSAAAPIIQILAWVGLLQSLQSLNTDILQALGRPAMVLRFSLLFFTAHALAFGVGLQWGVVGVAVGYAISSTLVEPVYTVITARALGVSPWRFAANLAGPAQAGAAMALALLLARTLLVQGQTSAGLRLLILIPLGAAVFVPVCLWRAPEVRRELRQLRRRRARPPLPAVQPTPTT